MKIKIASLCILTVVISACGMLPGAGNGNGNQNSAAPATNGSPATAEPTPKVAATDRKDLLATGNGAFVVAATSASSWKPNYVIDEIPKSGWASESGKTKDQSITIELTAKTTLKTLSFDTAQVEGDTGAKDITVEISDASATDGFQEILAATLKDKVDKQEFPVAKTVGGRWVRINFKTNYGSDNYVELMDIHGYGDQETPAPLENITGTYESDYGNFHIKQEGTSVVGCYEYAKGLVQGGIENRMMKVTWQESRMDNEKVGGAALLFFSQDGKTFLGLYGRNDDEEKRLIGQWNGKKISNKAGSCEHLKTLDGEKAVQSQIGKNLADTGRAVIYGINFDFNSDVIKPESRITLDQIAAVLQENKDWKMTVEGHTDNIGGDAFNKTLSDKRAAAVKAYLIGKGIDAGRLNSSGMGMSKPVTTNDTEAGRAQNRRVELVKN